MRSAIRSASMTITATLMMSSSWFLLAAARAPAPGDACSLLTKEDAAAALGEAATGPKATGPMSDGTGSTVSGCEYTGSGIHSIQLNLTRLLEAVCEALQCQPGDLLAFASTPEETEIAQSV